jgi:hypothetical protein
VVQVSDILQRYGPLSSPYEACVTSFARLRDWAIVEDGRTVGRIVQDGSASTPPDRRWSWSIVIFVSDRTGMVTSGRAPTLSEAKADFKRNWTAVRAAALLGPDLGAGE